MGGYLSLILRQDQFMKQYLGYLRDHIIRDDAVLIYVFDVASTDVEVIF